MSSVSSDTVGFDRFRSISIPPSNRLTEKIRHWHWRWRRSRSRRSSSLPGLFAEPMDQKRIKKSVVLLSRHPCWGVEYCDSTHIILNILESVCSWQLSPIVVLIFKQTLNMPGKRRSGSFLFPINLSATIWSYLSSCNRSKVLTSASTSTWMPCQTCNKS